MYMDRVFAIKILIKDNYYYYIISRGNNKYIVWNVMLSLIHVVDMEQLIFECL